MAATYCGSVASWMDCMMYVFIWMALLVPLDLTMALRPWSYLLMRGSFTQCILRHYYKHDQCGSREDKQMFGLLVALTFRTDIYSMIPSRWSLLNLLFPSLSFGTIMRLTFLFISEMFWQLLDGLLWFLYRYPWCQPESQSFHFQMKYISDGLAEKFELTFMVPRRCLQLCWSSYFIAHHQIEFWVIFLNNQRMDCHPIWYRHYALQIILIILLLFIEHHYQVKISICHILRCPNSSRDPHTASKCCVVRTRS